ncbi:MAG: radical SAM protein, partial [Erysipelotrichales bacterium]|nr:radical SAM protein [Erysipelotrichales bacterium]
MIDAYGRNIDYLRISVTDRCNFRCQYCMPEEGIELCKHDEMLTFDEITRIVRIMASIGFRKIKLTGGEPLVRKGVHSLVEDIRKIDGIKDITMTTNGYLLEDEIDKLVEKGLTGINISLDTLEDTLFKNITRVDGLER